MSMFKIALLFFILFGLPCQYVQASLKVYASERNGLPIVELDGKRILSSRYVFWGPSWKWAGINTSFDIEKAGQYSSAGLNKNLSFTLNSEIERDEKKIVWDFILDASQSKEGIIGGGIEFNLDPQTLESTGIYPELIPDNKGWTWNDIQVSFEPAMASVYFERGRKSKIRTFFFNDRITAGKKKIRMILTSSERSTIMPTISERFEATDLSSWHRDGIHWQNFPLDLSHLNEPEKPAGKRGFLVTRGDRLAFEDGTEARFWGANLSAYSLFGTSKANIKHQAKRLSRLGFNLVRLHHHDSHWANPNIFGSKPRTDTQNLSRESLDKLDWWIKCLKDEGIYTWLDLHVQRYFKRGDDIYAFSEFAKKNNGNAANLKGYNYVNLTIKNAMKRFNRLYVNHVNPYTDLAYKDDPAIIALLLTNENDITHHFGNALLPDKKVPKHNKIYMQEAKVFAQTHGLPESKTWRSWEHGPSKLFLNDLEYRFNREMISELRRLGVRVPIITTSSWGGNPLSSLPALTAGEMIDVHAYGGTLEIEKNPITADSMTHWMSAGQVAGMPMSVTEWNVSRFPVPDRHSNPLLVASKASHQGWDALMFYAYAQDPLNNEGKPSSWNAYNDPSLLATLPAAALLYRQGHVAEASTVYYLDPGMKLYKEPISAKHSAAIRTASEKGKLVIGLPPTPSLPWLKPSNRPKDAVVINDHRQSLISPGAKSVTSDTGQLYRNWFDGIYTVDTPSSQLATGWLGGKSIELSQTRFRLNTVNATIAIQSLDDQPIQTAGRLLISLGSNSLPNKVSQGRSKKPFLSQPINGKIEISARKGMKLVSINDLGERTERPANYEAGWYEIDLGGIEDANWLILEKRY